MQSINDHCAEIENCNQRGGRMLSIVDLIEAGTMSRELAAYSLAAIGNGASFMVGALPGGAGKTTVMGALLNFVPRDVSLTAADSESTIACGLAERSRRRCYVCHEIGAGHYYAYLWGKALRVYFTLPAAGHMMATNLHADTFEQARRQVCEENGVDALAFRRMNLIYFLALRRSASGVSRQIAAVWESDGKSEHRQVFSGERSRVATDEEATESTKAIGHSVISVPFVASNLRGKGDSRAAVAQSQGPQAESRLVSTDAFRAASETIDRLLCAGVRRIEDVRSMMVRRG
jgi:hypothetical protein